jgi:Fe-S-cluster containining protein
MNDVWYKKGLPFKCTGCGKCCSGPPGYVWVSENEIQEMADYLKMSFDDFTKKYIRIVSNRYSLMERKVGIDFECVFLRGKQCMIYGVRPRQCKTFPWWPQNLESEKTWDEAALECEGINSSAPLVPLETIQRELGNLDN